jgi:hypothetical protein
VLQIFKVDESTNIRKKRTLTVAVFFGEASR